MSEKYPPPADAITAWLSSDRQVLHLALSGAGMGDNVVAIPLSKCSIEKTPAGAVKASQAGWLILLDILKARQRDAAEARTMHIATSSRPVQYDIEKVLNAIQRYDKQGRAEAVTVESLEDLDLE